MDWSQLTEQLDSAYSKEIPCYRKLVMIYQQIHQELTAGNMDAVLELQLQQKEFMGEIVAVEATIKNAKAEWQKRGPAERNTQESRLVAEKIAVVGELIKTVMGLKEDALGVIEGRQHKKSREIRQHRLNKSAHQAYQKPTKPDALFWDRKS